MPQLYPGAIWHPSPIRHDLRPSTVGIVEHWTAGHEQGDLATLTGGKVDSNFYVTKSGLVYQLLPLDSQSYHAFHTANQNTVSIEHENSGEGWTPEQFAATSKLNAWLCVKYGISVTHAKPKGIALNTWRGLFDHKDLQGIDGNNHSDGVPNNPGWDRFLKAVSAQISAPPLPLPHGNTLRLKLEGHPIYAGWDDCLPVMRSIAKLGMRADNKAWIAFNGGRWYGGRDVENVIKALVHKFNL